MSYCHLCSIKGKSARGSKVLSNKCAIKLLFLLLVMDVSVLLSSVFDKR